MLSTSFTATLIANTIRRQSVCTGRKYTKTVKIAQTYKSTSSPPYSSRQDFKYPKRLIFIAATDDKEWLKGAIAVNDDIYFSTDLFSSVGIEAPGPGEDLAMLSLCNHFILSVSNLTKDCVIITLSAFSKTLIHLPDKHLWTVGSTAVRRTGSQSFGNSAILLYS